MARWLLALVLLGWGQFGFSATYNFTNSTDAVKACQAAERSGSYPGSWCQVYGQQQQAILVSSIGSIIHAYKWSGCPSGQVPTGTGGQCVAPQVNECEGKLGNQVSWDSSGVVFEGCVDNCSVALTGSSFSDSNSRRAYKPDASDPVLFRNTGLYTGESCGGASAPIQTVDIPPTEFQSDNECSATVTDGEGRKLSSCTTTDIYKDQRACVQAGGYLGNVNGMLDCVKNKGPKATQTTTETKVTTEPKPDGGTKTTTETTTTTKNCIGTNSCTTSTTTTTNVSNTNADGTKGGETSTCKGDKCGSDGKSNEGKEDGKDDKEEEQDGIEGPSDSLAKGEQGDFSEGISEWDQKIQDARDDLTDKIDQLSGQFSGVFDLNLGGGGGSLPCETVYVSFGQFGSTNINLCLAAYDQYLGFLRYILLLAATVMAAFIVMRN